jgi:hypothetical protein
MRNRIESMAWRFKKRPINGFGIYLGISRISKARIGVK